MKLVNFFSIQDDSKSEKIRNLNTFRALAILLGLIWNFMQTSKSTPSFSYLLSTGPWGGANPLFLISGYLLGNQLLSRLSSNANISFFKFYCRRAFKTWPNYFILILFFLLFTDFFKKSNSNNLINFLTFTQNFNLTNSPLSHTWSLCIEEHFYLLLPFLIILFFKKRFSKLPLVFFLFTVALGMFLRNQIWITNIKNSGLESFQIYFNSIYYLTYCRLDGLIIGVGLAYLKNFKSSLWTKLIIQANKFFILGLFCCIIGFLLQVHRTNQVSAIFLFPIISFGFGSLLISALNPNSFFSLIKIPKSNLIAILSYALYIVHKPVEYLISNFLIRYNLPFGLELVFSLFLCFVISFLCSYILYILVEKPCLQLRNKFFPNIEDIKY